MARYESCYRCGKVKLATRNIHTDKHLMHKDLEMIQMSYGKNAGAFRCKDCKTDSVFFKGYCPECNSVLHEGYNNYLWCNCGYSDRSKENPELNKRDYNLLKGVF